MPFGKKSANEIDRYLRSRLIHKHASSDYLWLGYLGVLTSNGIYQIIKRRVKEAGIKKNVFLHLFRHGLVDQWARSGGEEGDLQTIGGWETKEMLRRYGASTRLERAKIAHDKYSPGDKF